jgi:hypothetical protein
MAIDRGIRAISYLKLLKGFLLVVSGVGLLKLLNKDLADVAIHCMNTLHLDPDNRHFHKLLLKASLVNERQSKELSSRQKAQGSSARSGESPGPTGCSSQLRYSRHGGGCVAEHRGRHRMKVPATLYSEDISIKDFTRGGHRLLTGPLFHKRLSLEVIRFRKPFSF